MSVGVRDGVFYDSIFFEVIIKKLLNSLPFKLPG